MIVSAVLVLAACKKDKEEVCECNDNTKHTETFDNSKSRVDIEHWCFGIQHEKNKPALASGKPATNRCEIK